MVPSRLVDVLFAERALYLSNNCFFKMVLPSRKAVSSELGRWRQKQNVLAFLSQQKVIKDPNQIIECLTAVVWKC